MKQQTQPVYRPPNTGLEAVAVKNGRCPVFIQCAAAASGTRPSCSDPASFPLPSGPP